MKTIPYIFGLTLLILIFNACADNLELQPEQSLSPDIVTTNAANIQNLLVGIYDEAGQIESYGGDLNLGIELLADDGDLSWNGTFEAPATFIEKQIVVSNGFVRDYWLNAYEVSNQVNIVLESLDNIEDSDERTRIEGEAKFLRAVVYFDLVRLFGLPYEAGAENSQLAVPIVLSPVLDASQIEFPERNTVEEVYTQVIADLNDAYNLLPNSNGIFADKFSAQALLARVYLQQGNFAPARDAANDVLQNSGHTLTSDFASAFNNAENSIEDIFAWQITSQDGVNDMNLFWATQDFGGRSGNPDISINNSHLNIYDDEDDERSSFFYEGDATATTKWQQQFANIPFLRIAEMHLIRAESNFRESTTIGLAPEAEINALRARSGASPLTGIALQDITDERKRELSFEGFTLHDIKRLKGNVGNLAYDDPKLVMPVPQRETDANPSLQQNPGY